MTFHLFRVRGKKRRFARIKLTDLKKIMAGESPLLPPTPHKNAMSSRIPIYRDEGSPASYNKISKKNFSNRKNYQDFVI
jgi:hypothetical protein